jgi:hypothetical protein
MDYKKIFLAVIILVILIFIYYWIFNNSGAVTILKLKDANTSVDVEKKIINSQIFSWSMWLYVKEYTTKYGEKKHVLVAKTGTKMQMEIYLDENVNDLIVDMNVHHSNTVGFKKVTTKVENFPIQKWTHLLVSYRNRAMDIYLDGKIVKTKVLNDVLYSESGEQLQVVLNPVSDYQITTPLGKAGFNGFLGTLQHFTYAVQPEESYAIYKAGYNGGNWLGDLFNKYKLKVSFMEDSKEINSLVF